MSEDSIARVPHSSDGRPKWLDGEPIRPLLDSEILLRQLGQELFIELFPLVVPPLTLLKYIPLHDSPTVATLLRPDLLKFTTRTSSAELGALKVFDYYAA